MAEINTGFVQRDNARIYFEDTGKGQVLIFIHAGVVDSRQWKNEFTYFANDYRVIRYDIRGYGQSEPVEGEYNNLEDLVSLHTHLKVYEPVILVGCSMGGGLAMDFALAYPSRVKKLIMVDSEPNGLDLDVDGPSDKFEEAGKAFKAGDLDLAAEIEAQIWFDGMNRTPEQVNQEMRKLQIEMNRIALENESKGIGERQPNMQTEAFERLNEIKIPVLLIVGENDLTYFDAAADYMLERISSSQKVIISNAAHLPNMDQPVEFRKIVEEFLSN